VTQELLSEAHEPADMAVTTTMFFAGLLIFVALAFPDDRHAGQPH